MSALDLDELLKEVRFETFTSGGPGGQHANRSATAVKVIHVPTGLTAVAKDHRSQHRNKELALERLIEKIRLRRRPVRIRRKTLVPRAVKEKRLADKRHRSRLKTDRKKVSEE